MLVTRNILFKFSATFSHVIKDFLSDRKSRRLGGNIVEISLSLFSCDQRLCEERKFIVNDFFGCIRLQEDTETFRDNPRPSGMNSFFIKRSFYYYT